MSEQLIYVGEVAHRISTLPHVRLRPLLASSRDHSRWERECDGEREFPDRGFVFWPNHPPDVKVGSYWVFTVEKTPTYDGRSKREFYQVGETQSPSPAIECVDLRMIGDEHRIRTEITRKGVALHHLPHSASALRGMLRIDTDLFVGPVLLERDPKIDLWKIAESQALGSGLITSRGE